MQNIESVLEKRILLLDGALGSLINQRTIPPETKNFKGMSIPIIDILNISAPQIIYDIHLQYIKAGADIIETNTFNANQISLAYYNLLPYTYQINYEGAI